MDPCPPLVAFQVADEVAVSSSVRHCHRKERERSKDLLGLAGRATEDQQLDLFLRLGDAGLI
jgi:hypothetical protein